MKDFPEGAISGDAVESEAASSSGHFRNPVDPEHGLEDGRKSWDWRSKYPDEARKLIDREALIAGVYFAVFLLLTAVIAAAGTESVTLDLGVKFTVVPSILLTFAVGCLGGTTFSIKWLMHSCATGKWHLDRFYWRVFVPLTGGVYSVVVLDLMAAGMLGGAGERSIATTGTTAALAFLVGYFSDGVSGLLSNVANAVFGTVEKK